MNLKKILFVLSAIVLTLVCCTSGEKTIPNKDMSILAFIIADNDLDDHALIIEQDIIKGLRSCSTGTEVLIYMDRLKEPPTLNKYTLTNEGKIGVNHLRSYSEQCSTSPQIFRDALFEMRNNSSGKRYGLIYWSHGSGWLPAIGYANTVTRAIGMDEGVSMSVDEMANSMGYLDRAAFVVLDACYMGCAPVAYDLREVTDYLIASPTNIPGVGFSYAKMLPFFMEGTEQSLSVSLDIFFESVEMNVNRDSASFAIASVVKCSEMESLATRMREVVRSGRDIVNPEVIQSFDFDQYHLYYDLDSYASELSLDSETLRLFREQLNHTVIKAINSSKIWSMNQSGLVSKYVTRFCGLSSFIPGLGDSYYDWAFSKTTWYNKIYGQTTEQ